MGIYWFCVRGGGRMFSLALGGGGGGFIGNGEIDAIKCYP